MHPCAAVRNDGALSSIREGAPVRLD